MAFNDRYTRQRQWCDAMELLTDIVRQYWLNIVASAIFVAALVRYVRLAQWEQQLVPFAVAAVGFVCVVASDEVSDWTGRYGWSGTWRACSLKAS